MLIAAAWDMQFHTLATAQWEKKFQKRQVFYPFVEFF